MNNMNYEDLLQKYEGLEKQLQYYREYDLLTGVYNKETFFKRTRELFASDTQREYQIVCVDVERFKVVNDIYGTEKGNDLLKYLAINMNDKLAEEGCDFARISADIFASCIPVSITLHEIEEEIFTIFRDAPVDMEIVPAIGFYRVDNRTLPIELMCDRAILALNTVKGNYLKHAAVYDEDMRKSLLEEQEILSRADYALESGEFQVFMQPKCNMRTGKIVGAEALVRWCHPQKGIIPPNVFIPVFERNGFIKKLDTYIWESVAVWLQHWGEQGNRQIPISVNVSRMDIIGMDIFHILKEILEKYKVDSSVLELEITESAYTSHLEEIIVMVETLMRAGFTVLMDDFGSGYSSLNVLKDISIDILKLDLRFLDKSDKKSRDILESIVHMAKWLKLRVIAEGVETAEQVEFLLNLDCEYAQGFYYYKPMTIPEFEALLSDKSLVDYEDQRRALDREDNLISIRDLFHTDMMTDQLLNNILGGIALYQYDGNAMKIFKCNSDYYWLTHHEKMPPSLEEENVLEIVMEEDRDLLRSALLDAKMMGDKGAEVQVRRMLGKDNFIWLQVRLYFLSDTNGKSLYYASVSDVSEQMHAMESLQMSELKFRVAMEASGNTLFELDIPSKVATYARHSQQEFGLSDTVANAPEGFIEQGAVCSGYEEKFRDMYRAIYRGEDRAGCVIRAHMGDDSIVWNRITLIAVKNKYGKSEKAIGLVENVTKEIQLEEKLEQLETSKA